MLNFGRSGGKESGKERELRQNRVRGGADSFQWDAVKTQNVRDRECYLGQSTQIGTQQRGGDFVRHDWWYAPKDREERGATGQRSAAATADSRRHRQREDAPARGERREGVRVASEFQGSSRTRDRSAPFDERKAVRLLEEREQQKLLGSSFHSKVATSRGGAGASTDARSAAIEALKNQMREERRRVRAQLPPSSSESESESGSNAYSSDSDPEDSSDANRSSRSGPKSLGREQGSTREQSYRSCERRTEGGEES